MKYPFTFILLIHGLIHLMGFANAYSYANISQVTKVISKPSRFFWLMATILFMTSAAMFFLKKESWPMFAIAAVVISQVLIIMVWKDAKFGTIAT